MVVLGIENEEALLRAERKLIDAGVPHQAIREPDGIWNGALMAIGVMPAPRSALKKYLSNYPLLKELKPCELSTSMP